MSTDDIKLGYIGLGNQGMPMAKRLAEWPGGLVVFDVRTEAMTPLAELGASLADSVADVADADVIVAVALCVAEGSSVRVDVPLGSGVAVAVRVAVTVGEIVSVGGDPVIVGDGLGVSALITRRVERPVRSGAESTRSPFASAESGQSLPRKSA